MLVIAKPVLDSVYHLVGHEDEVTARASLEIEKARKKARAARGWTFVGAYSVVPRADWSSPGNRAGLRVKGGMGKERAIEAFTKRFGTVPELVSAAPGRVNLIGEHTDYSDGFVFPAAIERRLYVAASRSGASTRAVSAELGEGQEFRAEDVAPGSVQGWTKYLAGMAWALRERGHSVPNLNVAIASDVPIGSGVSSSAAIEMAIGVAWNDIANLELKPADLALTGQRCENGFVGVSSGIMDQMASAMGRSRMAMFLDTRSLEITYASLPAAAAIVILDTGKARALAGSAYNERRAQVEQAAKALGVAKLRDATEKMLQEHANELDPVVFKRARHVVRENDRCTRFLDALTRADLPEIAKLMKDSHISLRDDFEVSSKELDAMAEAAWKAPGCIGARMTGAGFGGACVALADRGLLPQFLASVEGSYTSATGLAGSLAPVEAVAGASVLQR